MIRSHGGKDQLNLQAFGRHASRLPSSSPLAYVNLTGLWLLNCLHLHTQLSAITNNLSYPHPPKPVSCRMIWQPHCHDRILRTLFFPKHPPLVILYLELSPATSPHTTLRFLKQLPPIVGTINLIHATTHRTLALTGPRGNAETLLSQLEDRLHQDLLSVNRSAMIRLRMEAHR